ncbi:MAG: YhgE/Pip domain-containing protein, partial [candidate division SR1 bacterium]|nr:YhgE/Pip domain-containing protein [candidate division SR1 bacterium]
TNINDVQSTLSKSSLLAQNSLNFLNTTPEKIKGYKSDLQTIANDIDGEFSRILDKADQKNQNFAQDLQRINPKLSQLEQQVGNQAASLQQVRLLISGLFPGAPILTKLDAAIANLNTVSSKSSSLRGTLSSVQSEVQETIDFSRDTQKAITSLRDDMRTTLDEVHTNYQNDIEPLLTEVLKEIDTLSQQGTEKLDTLEKKLPQVEKNIDGGIEILNTEIEKIRSFQDKLPKLQSSVHVIDNQLQKLKKSGKVEELIQLATLNPRRFSDFVSEPVELVENKLFSIPNYGSAMSPFFTTLAIWVGSLLSISLFTTKTREKAFQNFKSYQKYLGKWLFFLTIALLQGIVVSLGDMWLLDAYVANPRAFFFASLQVALVFSMIVYTTVSTFGSAGKAIVIIFLVLQLSGAGGTFPIELSGAFFQSINPFLPFTYAIAAMREAVGGVVWEIYLPNLIILLGFFGVFLLLGLFVKPLIASKVERFESKFSESELGEH